jgi:hypothetical protein
VDAARLSRQMNTQFPNASSNFENGIKLEFFRKHQNVGTFEFLYLERWFYVVSMAIIIVFHLYFAP